jgi:hypothetical protein
MMLAFAYMSVSAAVVIVIVVGGDFVVSANSALDAGQICYNLSGSGGGHNNTRKGL